MDKKNSEEESMLNPVRAQPVQSDDRGYGSCDSKDMKRGFIRYKKRKLTTWL